MLGAGVAAALTKAAVDGGNWADQVGDMAQVLGTTKADTQAWMNVLKGVDLGLDQMRMGVAGVSKAVDDAGGGSDKARKAFSELGLDWRQLSQQNPTKTLADVASALNRVQDAQKKASLAQALGLGGRASKILALGDVNAALKAERESGTFVNDRETENLAKLSAQLDELAKNAGQAWIKLAGEGAPVLIKFVEHMNKALDSFGRWIDANPQAAQGLFKWATLLVPVSLGIGTAGKALTGFLSLLVNGKLAVALFRGGAGELAGALGGAATAAGEAETAVAGLAGQATSAGANVAGLGGRLGGMFGKGLAGIARLGGAAAGAAPTLATVASGLGTLALAAGAAYLAIRTLVEGLGWLKDRAQAKQSAQDNEDAVDRALSEGRFRPGVTREQVLRAQDEGGYSQLLDPGYAARHRRAQQGAARAADRVNRPATTPQRPVVHTQSERSARDTEGLERPRAQTREAGTTNPGPFRPGSRLARMHEERANAKFTYVPNRSTGFEKLRPIGDGSTKAAESFAPLVAKLTATVDRAGRELVNVARLAERSAPAQKESSRTDPPDKTTPTEGKSQVAAGSYHFGRRAGTFGNGTGRMAGSLQSIRVDRSTHVSVQVDGGGVPEAEVKRRARRLGLDLVMLSR